MWSLIVGLEMFLKVSTRGRYFIFFVRGVFPQVIKFLGAGD